MLIMKPDRKEELKKEVYNIIKQHDRAPRVQSLGRGAIRVIRCGFFDICDLINYYRLRYGSEEIKEVLDELTKEGKIYEKIGQYYVTAELKEEIGPSQIGMGTCQIKYCHGEPVVVCNDNGEIKFYKLERSDEEKY